MSDRRSFHGQHRKDQDKLPDQLNDQADDLTVAAGPPFQPHATLDDELMLPHLPFAEHQDPEGEQNAPFGIDLNFETVLLPPGQTFDLNERQGLPPPIPPLPPIEENVDKDQIVPANQNPAGSGAGPSGVAAGRVRKGKTGVLKDLSAEQLECLRKYINKDRFSEDIFDDFKKKDGPKIDRRQVDRCWRELRKKDGVKSKTLNIWVDAEIEVIKKWKAKPENEKDYKQCTRELRELGIKDRKYKTSAIKEILKSATFLNRLYTKEFRNELNELYIDFLGSWQRVLPHLGFQYSDRDRIRKVYENQTTNEKVPTEWSADELNLLNTQLQTEEAKGYNQIDWKAIKSPLIGRSIGSIKRKLVIIQNDRWPEGSSPLLQTLCEQYRTDEDVDYVRVSGHYQDISPLQCMLRHQYLSGQISAGL